MRSVHFGAGNIGRGFIGQVLNRAGYEITFVDVQDKIVDALQKERRYDVILADESGERIPVDGVTALHSGNDKEAVVERVAGADLVTTAVGPNVLPAISGIIADGLAERARASAPPVNVIACENMVGGSEALRGYVMQHVPEESAGDVERVSAFPDSAVDRIVPEQSNEGLDVSVEPFYEWVVETSRIKGERPDVEGITYVDELAPYIERKLFTVNTGHAAVAYLGYARGWSTIAESVEDDSLREEVLGVLGETGRLLVEKHDFDEADHDRYKHKILARFRNPYISDDVTRVARTPIRKLGREERLVSPASQLLERGVEPVHLAEVIGAVLRYEDSGDEEAVELQEMIHSGGERATLAQCAGISEDHPLVELVLEEIEKR
ncbi:mannitol-1-phosphate 5-dehydrogenase [Rubrobacter aplysinae]|uniref:mannitol-1-phosphate 5-dehydrogenase n=1 Tax=Rubrobacter aplysinae TaxID=909625 RepID=UPI00064B865C|nr:mannitol-1-phosphate 5-dehydrogenase [Rubrobacter aplysinae]